MEINLASYRLPQNDVKNLVFNHFMSINLEVNFFADQVSESVGAKRGDAFEMPPATLKHRG